MSQETAEMLSSGNFWLKMVGLLSNSNPSFSAINIPHPKGWGIFYRLCIQKRHTFAGVSFCLADRIKLGFVKLSVEAVLGHQGFVVALFNDFATVQHQNMIR